MHARTLLAIGLLGTGVGCSRDDSAARAAVAAFERFQDSIFARDAESLRSLVTEESRPAIEGMPLADLALRPRLVVRRADDMRGSFFVSVRDPGDGDASGTYVVVRERGRLVVDLVATAELSAVPTGRVEAGGYEMRELTAEDHDELHRRRLATPSAEPVR